VIVFSSDNIKFRLVPIFKHCPFQEALLILFRDYFPTRITFPTHLNDTDWQQCAVLPFIVHCVRWSHLVPNLHRLIIQFSSLFTRVLTHQLTANFKISTNVQKITKKQILKENRKATQYNSFNHEISVTLKIEHKNETKAIIIIIIIIIVLTANQNYRVQGLLSRHPTVIDTSLILFLPRLIISIVITTTATSSV
jgi:hypothetical protein